jgi:hypothetical protein
MTAETGSSASASAAGRAAIAVVLLGFLAFGAATLDDYGLTWDEGVKVCHETAPAAIVARIAPHDPRVLHIPGYFYVVDTTRCLYAGAVRSLLPDAHVVLVYHSFSLLLSTACLWLLYALALDVSGSRRLALAATLALALMPQFVGHAQNNPKDLPAMLLYLWSARRIVAASARPGLGRFAGTALVLGVALTSRVLSVLVLPTLVAWLWLRHRERIVGPLRGWIATAAASGFVALLCWPALWIQGLDVVETARERLVVLGRLNVDVLYLGELFRWTELPWHYSLVQLLIGLPLVHLAGLALAAAAAARWRDESRRRCDLLWLGALWCGVLLAADLFSPLHYDGIRHLLPILPGIALLVGSGCDLALDAPRLARSTFRAVALRAAVASAVAVTLLELAAMHPYQTSYLNPLANALAGPRNEEWVETEYWGATYKAGSEWLSSHAPADAIVYVPIGGGQRAGEDVARYYLDLRVAGRGRLRDFEDTSVPQYLMIMARKAWYDEFVRGVRQRYAPVHTIERQGSTLLEIYSNRAPAPVAR